MLVHRLTFSVKPGSEEKAIEMIKESLTIHKAPHGQRIVEHYLGGKGSTIVVDIEFDNLSGLEAWWTEWWSLPGTPAHMEKWVQLLAASTKDTVFTLVE